MKWRYENAEALSEKRARLDLCRQMQLVKGCNKFHRNGTRADNSSNEANLEDAPAVHIVEVTGGQGLYA